MNIYGISTNLVPLWVVNSERVILEDVSVGLPSARFKNALISGIYQSNRNIAISSSGIRSASFSPTEHLVTGQVTTTTLSGNTVICNTGDRTNINSTSAVVNSIRITNAKKAQRHAIYN